MNKRTITRWLLIELHLKYIQGAPVVRDGMNIIIANQRPYAYNGPNCKIRCGMCNTEHHLLHKSLSAHGKRCTGCNSKITTTHTFAVLDDKTPTVILNKIKSEC